ncbi:MAG: DUF4340 domain-containing protein [Planctomycetaceae bacterium]|nr:DUF4340 domain-containing protein [Planctomycetaceae bacterium]
MNNRKLAILGVIAVVTAGWAVLQSRISRPAVAADFGSSPLIEGLGVDSIASISISGEGGKTVTLDRTEGGFVVRDKLGYPADISKINGLLNKCLDIRVRDKITSNAANHADLKVTPETARCVVTFMGKDGKVLTGMAISPGDPQNGQAHARLLSSSDVYVIDSDPYIGTSAMDYINSKLLEVPRDKMKEVAVNTPKDHYMLAAESADAVKLAEVPAGQKQKDAECKSVFGALSYLTFEDAVKEAPAEAIFDHSYSGKLNDTTVYKLAIAKLNDKFYAKVSAEFLDKTPVEKERRVESEDELKAKEAKLQAIDAVNNFNARHAAWIYQLPSYKAQDLTKAMADLTESAAPAPDKKADATAAAEKAEAIEQPVIKAAPVPAAAPQTSPSEQPAPAGQS